MKPVRLLGTAYLAWHVRGQARFPFQPPCRAERAQAHGVRETLRHAYATVPYYRETLDRLGLRPDDFRGAADLARLPLLEREAVQRDPEYFVSRSQPLAAYLAVLSGGSSGQPRTIFHDARSLLRNAAHAERERGMVAALVGRPLGYRELVVAAPGGTDLDVQRFSRLHAVFPPALGIQRRFVSLADAPRTVVSAMNDFRPHVVRAYGSYLSHLFAWLAATGTPFHRPRALTYSSDGLSEAGRKGIAERFGLPIFSTYESVEAFKMGFECERHVGLHLNVDLYPLRLVDGYGRDVPPGESGEVVVSNLVNRASVLLNYRLGDVSRMLPEPCACGRTLPLMAFPQGRTDDWLLLGSGRRLHGQVVRVIESSLQGVWEYQVVQEAVDHVRVLLVASPACDRRAIRATVPRELRAILGAGTRVDFVFVDTIARTAKGKLRTIVSPSWLPDLAPEHQPVGVR